MIDLLVAGILVLLAAVVVIWLIAPRVRAAAERPKHEMLARIVRFEAAHPRRDVVDPHASRPGSSSAR